MALSPKNQAARSACGASGGTADELVDASLQGLGGAVVGHGHEDRVVAADRAEDAVEARSVDGESHRLGGPRRGAWRARAPGVAFPGPVLMATSLPPATAVRTYSSTAVSKRSRAEKRAMGVTFASASGTT